MREGASQLVMGVECLEESVDGLSDLVREILASIEVYGQQGQLPKLALKIEGWRGSLDEWRDHVGLEKLNNNVR